MSTREHGLPSAAVRVEDMIVAVRGERVILDRDLARLYDVTTKALNQAVKRNPGRFPSEFMFRLTFQEVADLKSQSVTSRARANRSQIVTGSEKHRNPRFPPFAFTEHGALMAAKVLRSPQAVDVSVFVVRVFVRLRRSLTYHTDLAHRLDDLEKKHNAQLKVVFDAIRQLMTPVAPPRRSIGFRVEEGRPVYRRRRRQRSSAAKA